MFEKKKEQISLQVKLLTKLMRNAAVSDNGKLIAKKPATGTTTFD